jgi:hypothetical protein
VSTSPITGSLVSQIADLSSRTNQSAPGFSPVLAGSAAQLDVITLTVDAQNGAPASSSTNSVVNELDQLGAVLEGNMGAAQVDMLPLESTALSVTAAAIAAANGSLIPPTPAIPANEVELEELIPAMVQAMETGDSAAAGTDLSQLAAILEGSAGASNLQILGAAAASSAASVPVSPVSPLLQTLNQTQSGDNQPTLSERA